MADTSVSASLRAERDEAIRVLRAGADAVNHVEPPAAREPIRWMLTAAADQCAAGQHILGLPVVYHLELAQVLIDADGAALRGGES